jgi:hypothetical protein
MNFFKQLLGRQNVSSIDHIDQITDFSDFIQDYKETRTPVLLKSGASDWPLMQKWSKEYISTRMGSYVCKVVKDSRPAYAQGRTTLKKYFQHQSLSDSTLTLDQFNPSKPPLFFQDIAYPNPFFTKRQIHRFFYFHAHKNAGTLPHIHGNAFNILQEGKKEWIFYDASKEHNPQGYEVLQDSNRRYGIGSHAKDWFRKEVPRLPRKLDHVYRCEQQPGDIVFIPHGFCHAVLNHSEVMGIVFETK